MKIAVGIIGFSVATVIAIKAGAFSKIAKLINKNSTKNIEISKEIINTNKNEVAKSSNKIVENTLKQTYKQTIEKFPSDEKYYKNIAQNLGLKEGEEYKLSSLVGSSQLENILKTVTKEDFTVGENLSGVKNRTLRINLHNHTTASDGKLTPAKMLEQAKKWADEVFSKKGDDGKPPFVLAITDHDTMNGAKEIVKIISEAPEKYKNLKVVLGSELSVAHLDPKDVKSPMNFELIGYGLNPFNKKLNVLLDKVQQSRFKLVSSFIDKVKDKYPKYDLNIEDTKFFHANLKNMRTNGGIYLNKEYLTHKIMFSEYVNEINEKIIPKDGIKLNATDMFRKSNDNFYMIKDTKGYKGDGIAEYYKDYVLTPILEKNKYLTITNKKTYDEIFKIDCKEQKEFIRNTMNKLMPTINDTKGYLVSPKEIFEANDGNGFFGVAHPGLINTSMFSKDVEDVCNNFGYDKGQHLAWRLFSALKKDGGDLFKASEVNYQSYPKYDEGGIKWIKYMGEGKATEFNLLRTGGIDCHKPSIFKKHSPLSSQEIKDANLERIID